MCLGAVVAGAPSTFFGLVALELVALAIYFFIAADAFLSAQRRSVNYTEVKGSLLVYGVFAVTLYVVAVCAAIIGRSYCYQAYKIPSGAMEPALLVGDHILVDKRFHTARRGDVIVFRFPPDPTKVFVKRVIGLPGDTIQVKDGRVWLDGSRMSDSHAHYEVPDAERSLISPRDNFGPVIVPAGDVFVLGDNRDRSYDSRFWGFVGNKAIKGRVLYVYWSWDSGAPGLLPIRWSRIGTVVD